MTAAAQPSGFGLRSEQIDDLDDVLVSYRSAPRPGPRGLRLPAFIAKPVALVRAVPDIATYTGTLLILVGFGLLAIAWGKIAGLTLVSLQLPFLASAGFPGLGLVICGVAVISGAARARDGAARRDQLRELTATLTELKTLLADEAEGAE